MKNDAPNGLVLPAEKKVRAFKLSRWPLYVVLFGVGVLVAVLVYSVNFAHVQGDEERRTKAVDIIENEKPLLMGEGKGLSLLPPNDTAIVVPEVPTPVAPNKKEPLIIVQASKENEQYRQELEMLRRRKAEAQLAALASPLGVKKAADNGVKWGNATQAGSAGAAPGGAGLSMPSIPQEGGYDPAAAKDKEEFFARAKNDDTWTLQHQRTPGKPLELKTGGVIPAAMITGINSDLPGQITAQVTQNVYDTAWGKHLLMPQGSKLSGVYDSRVVYGQKRVLVAWNRVIFPDGSAITLGAMPGADVSGYAGFTDKVNNHYIRIFGSAVFMSLISGGMAYTMDTLDGSNSDNDKPTMQQEMGSALAAQLGQTSLQLLQKNINIAPTLEIRPGYQFNIVVTKDVVFERPYAAWR